MYQCKKLVVRFILFFFLMIVFEEDYFYYVGCMIVIFLVYGGLVLCFFFFVLFEVLVWGFEKIKVFVDLVLDEVVWEVLIKVCNIGYCYLYFQCFDWL